MKAPPNWALWAGAIFGTLSIIGLVASIAGFSLFGLAAAKPTTTSSS